MQYRLQRIQHQRPTTRVAGHGKAAQACERRELYVGSEKSSTGSSSFWMCGPICNQPARLSRARTQAAREDGDACNAEGSIRKALELLRRVEGEEHPRTLLTATNLAFCLCLQGRYQEAEATYRNVLAIQEHVLGAQHAVTLETAEQLAHVVLCMQHDSIVNATATARARLHTEPPSLTRPTAPPGPTPPGSIKSRPALSASLDPVTRTWHQAVRYCGASHEGGDRGSSGGACTLRQRPDIEVEPPHAQTMHPAQSIASPGSRDVRSGASLQTIIFICTLVAALALGFTVLTERPSTY